MSVRGYTCVRMEYVIVHYVFQKSGGFIKYKSIITFLYFALGDVAPLRHKEAVVFLFLEGLPYDKFSPDHLVGFGEEERREAVGKRRGGKV